MKITNYIIATLVALASLSTYGQVSYPINATGQRLCYDEKGEVIANLTRSDALYGQDGHYLRGAELSFADNGDSTVSDLNTGLMWQQSPPLEGMSWAEAKAYCESLTLGGYSDWRLPSLKELFSISDFSAGWPYIDTLYFSLSYKQITKDEQYWADNKYVGETVEGRNDAAFGVNHVTGHIKAYPAGSQMERPAEQMGGNQQRRPPMGASAGRQQHPRRETPRDSSITEGAMPPPPQGRPQAGAQSDSTERMMPPPPQGGLQADAQNGAPGGAPGRGGAPRGANAQGGQMRGNPMAKQVRAVRGELYGENHFVDNGDGTISDTATGLMWAQQDNGKGIEWIEALPYAEGATLAGYSDWRLPNVKELQSIVDYSRAPNSTTLEPAIDPIFSCTPFVNEAGDDDYGYYWSGTSACFTSGRPYCFAWYVAFGRAVNNQGADFHGAGAVRFDSKSDNGIAVEGGEERYYNFVRLVRDISAK